MDCRFLVFTLGPLILSLIMSFFDLAVDRRENVCRSWELHGNVHERRSGSEIFGDQFTVCRNLCAAESDHGAVPGDADYSAASWRQSLSYDFYIPAVISGVAVSIIWSWILNSDYGVLNYLLSLIGIEGPDWLVDPAWALFA